MFCCIIMNVQNPNCHAYHNNISLFYCCMCMHRWLIHSAEWPLLLVFLLLDDFLTHGTEFHSRLKSHAQIPPLARTIQSLPVYNLTAIKSFHLSMFWLISFHFFLSFCFSQNILGWIGATCMHAGHTQYICINPCTAQATATMTVSHHTTLIIISSPHTKTNNFKLNTFITRSSLL